MSLQDVNASNAKIANTNFKEREVEVEGNFMSGIVRWIREPEECELLRKIFAIIVATLLSLTIIGLVIVIPGVLEWHRQTYIINIPLPETHPNTKIEIINKTAIMTSELFKEVFSKTTSIDLEQIYLRMADYAKECGVSPETMVTKVKAGFEVAKNIAANCIKPNHSTDDLINIDWFMRAQIAKMNSLYMKGALKFPDPENKFATFINNTTSTYHGSTQKPKGRWSSHWPEYVDTIAKTPLKLTDGRFMCFSDKAEKKLRKTQNVTKENINNFGKPAICIDASGPDNCPDMGVAGKNNATFLVICFPEEEAKSGKDIPVIAIKTEGFSAVGVGEKGYGQVKDRINDNFKHSGQWVKKKGPKKLRKEVKEASPYRDLKEDKLNIEIRELLDQIKIVKGKKNGTPDEQNLYKSYKLLKETIQLGSDPSLNILECHLKLMLPSLKQNEIQVATKVIELISNHRYDVHSLSKDWTYQLFPRSEEVILPTIDEMITDKVPFCPLIKEN